MADTGVAPVALKTSGVHHVSLRTTDLARAKRFYLETLGFPLLLEAPNLFLFRAGATVFGIWGPEERTRGDDIFDPFRVGLDHVALACGDEAELERAAQALSAAGIENTGINTSPLTQKRYVAFWDPDRIKWEFFMV